MHNIKIPYLIIIFILACIIGIISITFGTALLESKVVIGNPYGYEINPDLIIINKFLGVLIAGLSFLIIHSSHSRINRSIRTSHFLNTLVRLILLTFIVLSAYLAFWGLSKASSQSISYWEKMPVAYQNYINDAFIKQFTAGAIEDCSKCNLIRVNNFTILGDRKPVLFMHPPSKISFRLVVPFDAQLSFSIGLAPAVWQPDMGDGVGFNIFLGDSDTQYTLFNKYIDPKNNLEDRRWYNYQIDLSLWTGHTVIITFTTDPGPNGDDRFDWAGWGEPSIMQPTAYDFLAELPKADRGGAGKKQVRQDTLTINDEQRPILFQYPSNRVTYRLTIPEYAMLYFGLGLDPSVWSTDKGDGVEYNIYVRKSVEQNALHRVFHFYIDPKHNSNDRKWLDQAVDLSEYSGQKVDIIFEALQGPSGIANFTLGGWSNPVLVAAHP